MDNIRKKLVELITPVLPDYSRAVVFADYLFKNGVTVRPVKIGDTVYGRFHGYVSGVQECKVVQSNLCQFRDGSGHTFLNVEFSIIDPYYRDGRLMRCGRQAVFGEDYGSWDRVYLTREEAEAQPPKGE
jgi:hypothetical protein